MATTIYESVLDQARQLTPEEQERLSEELTRPSQSSLVAALQSLGPLDPDIADAMERAIEEDCERVDVRD